MNFLQNFRTFALAGPKTDAPFGHSWQGLMRLALAEAQAAAKLGDVPVGAVVVLQTGQIVGLAGNCVEQTSNPTAHAEIIALQQAGKRCGSPRLTDAILVTTLEPCLMCAAAIAHARMAGVVYGCADKRAGALASAADLPNLPLGGRHFWHMGGILGEECQSMLTNYFMHLR